MQGIRVRVVAAWAVAMLLALFFIQTGPGKLNPSPALIERFDAWGYSRGLAQAIGVVETTGAMIVLVPSLAAYGAWMLAIVMVGAIYTHLSTGIGSPESAARMLVLAGALIALRAQDAQPLRRTRRTDPA
ncbi:MAG TPA: DoxX family protein [Acidobacteriota bacterium]|nr:DoxX family protein [Acidobacteriota bacterium]